MVSPPAAPVPAPARRGGAAQVALGIALSRVAGFVRERVLAHYFGIGAHADVFGTALRGPNLLQNLLGEQSLSASFIPTYSRLLNEGREEDAKRLAGAIFCLLLAIAGGLALVGQLFAAPIVALFAPGYLRDAAQVMAGTATVDRYQLAVACVRWIFPMTGLLVLSAWALGVLNSHRRFFVSYAAPVMWNAAMIAAVIAAVRRGEGGNLERLLFAVCVGALLGGLAQFLVQLPGLWRAAGWIRPVWSLRAPGVAETLRAFGPAVAGRGVVQLSSYLDQLLASLLLPGAVAALRYGQPLYLLPISLFGMSLAAASLPELAASSGGQTERFAARIESGLRRVGVLIVPSAVALLVFGPLVVGAIYRTGSFGAAEVALVAAVLGGYALGMPAAATSRLLQAGFYARGDTGRPARIAAARVALSTLVALPAMWWLDRLAIPGAGASPLRLGALGLALGASVGAWFELTALQRGLGRILPEYAFPWRELGKAIVLSGVAALIAGLVWWALPTSWHVALLAPIVLGAFGATYLVGLARLGPAEARELVGRIPLVGRMLQRRAA